MNYKPILGCFVIVVVQLCDITKLIFHPSFLRFTRIAKFLIPFFASSAGLTSGSFFFTVGFLYPLFGSK